MKFIFSLIIISIFCGCENKSTYHLSEDEKLANAITKKVALQINHEFGLIPCGTGGQMMDQIKMLHLAFDCRKPLDIDTSRQLLVAAVERFVSEVNANESIRPYLDNYPFEAKNIQIVIFIQRPDGSHFNPDGLVVTSAKDGVLEYKTDDPNGPLFKTVHSETYEEALKQLKNHPKSDGLQ